MEICNIAVYLLSLFFDGEGGGGIFFWNVSEHLADYTVLQTQLDDYVTSDGLKSNLDHLVNVKLSVNNPWGSKWLRDIEAITLYKQ